MELSNVSTNIVRDESKDIDFVVTPNTKEIFERIFSNKSTKSFNLIGNYGTGKSTFLWAFEKNLRNQKMFFSDKKNIESDGFDFLKLIGESSSLSEVLSQKLKLKNDVSSSSIIKALDKLRLKASKKNKGFIIIIDEFGKFLEYASKNNSSKELYLLQVISEWTNNKDNNAYFIVSLHQDFSRYSNKLSKQDRLEWEKVKGRFIDLVFNEPVEQLVFFASKKLNAFKLPKDKKNLFKKLLEVIKKSKLVAYTDVDQELNESLYPLDWLSTNVLVNSLQRYGQNERSLFSFLNDSTEYSIANFQNDFYTVANVYDYLVNLLSTEINRVDNPHRTQWLSTFRTLERAELIFEEDFKIASEVIKTIGLTNIFSKAGGLLDRSFIINYFNLSRGVNVSAVLDKLETSGLIRFYRYSNKINFLEGTDIDLEQELISVTKEINPNYSVSEEIKNLVDLPIILVKRYSFETGTRRFFDYKIFESFDKVSKGEGIIDGYINLVFDDLKVKGLKSKSKEHPSNIFVIYNNSKKIRDCVLTILKFNKLIEKHQDDFNARKLLVLERKYYSDVLEDLVVNNLFSKDNSNVWINNGRELVIESKSQLYNVLSSICYSIYSKTPVFNNELINKQFLTPPINTARKYLFKRLLERVSEKDLAFPNDKFPPEKAIYISLLKNTGIHKRNSEYDYFELSIPGRNSDLYNLWLDSEKFLKSSLSNKRNLGEFYEMLLSKPYKLKKGFVEFWIPVFLIAKKEDYALFHSNGGFIPFLDEDTMNFIHKRPQDFLIKSYDVTGLKLNLLESYKELVQIGDSQTRGTQSTFLSIFGNFLRFQRGLNSYTLKTQKLSSKAIKLREAIIQAKDPEDALFNLFPSALGFHSVSIKEDFEVLDSYTKHIQDAIREIREAYSGLLNRIEVAISEAFFCSSNEFKEYRLEIRNKLSGVDVNSLGKVQSIFYKRLISPLDDRVSWIKSVADVVLGKGIENILDEEEPLLISSIKDVSLGLIKASEIKSFNNNSDSGKLYSFRFFGESGEFVDDKFIIQKNLSKDFAKAKDKVSKEIDKLNRQERKELLVELLSIEMEL